MGLGVSSFSNGFLGQCVEENERLTVLTGAIIGGVIGGIALIIIAYLFIKWRKDHY